MRRAVLFFGAVLFVAGIPAQSHATAGYDEIGVAPLVARVSGPVSRHISIGKVLPLDQTFELGVHDQVTLLGPDGTRVLTGPGLLRGNHFIPSGTARKKTGRAVLGGMRGANVDAVIDPAMATPAKPTEEARPF
jgi:hypothetical protein